MFYVLDSINNLPKSFEEVETLVRAKLAEISAFFTQDRAGWTLVDFARNWAGLEDLKGVVFLGLSNFPDSENPGYPELQVQIDNVLNDIVGNADNLSWMEQVCAETHAKGDKEAVHVLRTYKAAAIAAGCGIAPDQQQALLALKEIATRQQAEFTTALKAAKAGESATLPYGLSLTLLGENVDLQMFVDEASGQLVVPGNQFPTATAMIADQDTRWHIARVSSSQRQLMVKPFIEHAATRQKQAEIISLAFGEQMNWAQVQARLLGTDANELLNLLHDMKQGLQHPTEREVQIWRQQLGLNKLTFADYFYARDIVAANMSGEEEGKKISLELFFSVFIQVLSWMGLSAQAYPWTDGFAEDLWVLEIKDGNNTICTAIYDLHERDNKSDNPRADWLFTSQQRTCIITAQIPADDDGNIMLATEDLLGLFHEGGHLMNLALWDSTYAGVGATHFYTEVPSMFMERLYAHPDVRALLGLSESNAALVGEALMHHRQLSISQFFLEAFALQEELTPAIVHDLIQRAYEGDPLDKDPLLGTSLVAFDHAYEQGYESLYFQYEACAFVASAMRAANWTWAQLRQMFALSPLRSSYVDGLTAIFGKLDMAAAGKELEIYG